MPRPSKGTGAKIRPPSHSSSTSRLGANLQFPQKDLPPQKHITDKFDEVHTSTKVAPPFVRLNSNQRLRSKEKLAPLKWQLEPPLQKPANGKSKPGLTIASPSEHGDDDDEWIASESGAASPNHHDSASDDTCSETDEDLPSPATHSNISAQHALTRVDCRSSMIHRCPTHVSEPESTKEMVAAPVSRHSPRPSDKHYSRPPSTHSISSRTELPLRPHPLIRGQSCGQLNAILPKPTPLAPLTSSTGSVNAIPIHSSISTHATQNRTDAHTRTFPTISFSSSSAALSSLTHLPYALSQTRPSSPNLHTISFFPPLNTQQAMEGIHPLLPVPYLRNHLTVVMRRTPIRESFDRVIRARSGGK